jgi:hypothetical protein
LKFRVGAASWKKEVLMKVTSCNENLKPSKDASYNLCASETIGTHTITILTKDKG